MIISMPLSDKHIWAPALALFALVVLLLVGWRLSRDPGRRLVWAEEFDGPEAILDLPKWENGTLAGGELRFITQSRYPGLNLREGLPFRAGQLDAIRVRMAADGPERGTRLGAHFTRAGQTKVHLIATEVTLTPAMTWFTLPLGREPLWRGEIATLRIDPVGDTGVRLRIDRVELTREARHLEGGPTPGWALALVQACGPVSAPLTALWLAAAIYLILSPPSRRFQTTLWILALALAPRIVYISLPVLDSFVISDPAQWVNSGRGIWSGEGPRGFPVWGWMWQAALGLLAGSGEGAQGTFRARLALALISAATAPLIYRLGRRLLPRRAALGAALLWSATEEPARFCGVLYSETLFTFVICLFLVGAFRARRRGFGRRESAALVAVSAVMVLTRSQAAPLAAAIWLWLARSRGIAVATRRAALPLAGFMIAGLFGGTLSFIQYREWIPLQTGLGQNLAVGHGPNANGRWVKLDPAWRAQAEAEKGWKARDNRYQRLALDNIRHDWGALFRLTAVKAGLLLNPWERSDWFYQPMFPFPLVPRWVHWALLLPGLLILRRRRAPDGLFLAHVGLTALLMMIFFYNERFLVPILPVTAIYAAAAPSILLMGAGGLWRGRTQRGRRKDEILTP